MRRLACEVGAGPRDLVGCAVLGISPCLVWPSKSESCAVQRAGVTFALHLRLGPNVQCMHHNDEMFVSMRESHERGPYRRFATVNCVNAFRGLA